MGTGAEQVIARGGTTVQVYGSKLVRPKTGVRRSVDYVKRVANHMHY